jgi:hypothetical protein
VDPDDLSIVVLDNPLRTAESNVVGLIQALLPAALPGLTQAFGSIALPTLLGAKLQGVEVSRAGSYLTIFLDLVPVPPEE